MEASGKDDDLARTEMPPCKGWREAVVPGCSVRPISVMTSRTREAPAREIVCQSG